MANQVFNEANNSIELDWFEENLVKRGSGMSVRVVVTDEVFDSSVYRGRSAFERYQRVVDGSERTMGRIEFAAACGKQQLLELMFCLFVKYGSEFPHDATYSLGVSQMRLLNSDHGDYYGEWLQCKMEYECVKSKVDKMEEMRRQLEEQQLKVIQAEESRNMLETYRRLYSQTKIDKLPKFIPQVGTMVAVRNAETQVLNVVHVGLPDKIHFDSEGVQISEEQVPRLSLDEMKLQEFCQEQKWMMLKQQKTIELKNQSPVVQMVAELENVNRTQIYNHIKKVGIEQWNLTPDEVCLLKTRQVEFETVNVVPKDQIEENDRRVIGLILEENENEKSREGDVFVMRNTLTNHFKFAWDIHAFGPLTHYNIAINVLWKDDGKGDVVRVIAANCKGELLTDMPVDGGNYEMSLFNARRIMHYLLSGATVYANNVGQKMSKIGLVGQSDRIVDLSELPMLKGKKSHLSLDKYQLRYGRNPQSLVNRKDPAVDNLLFCVFLMRRDGINWKHRRRRNMV